MAANGGSVRALFELKGRNYVVTGGAQGIGFATVRAISEMGGNVAVLDVQDKPREDLEAVAKEFNNKIAYFQADVSDEGSLQSAFDKAVEFLGALDGAVTAAGIAIDKAFVSQTWQEVERIQKINVMGTFFTAQKTVQQLNKQKSTGSIVLISSICAHAGLPGYRMAGYNASKGGVRMLTSALSTELSGQGIRVNSVAPAFTETEQTSTVRDANPAAADFMWTAPPLKRIGQPIDIVGAIVYLLSDAAAYTTGAEILITGGIHLGRGGDYAAYQ